MVEAGHVGHDGPLIRFGGVNDVWDGGRKWTMVKYKIENAQMSNENYRGPESDKNLVVYVKRSRYPSRSCLLVLVTNVTVCCMYYV